MIKVLVFAILSLFLFCSNQTADENTKDLNRDSNKSYTNTETNSTASENDGNRIADNTELVLKIKVFEDGKLLFENYYDQKESLRKSVSYKDNEIENTTEYFYKSSGELDKSFTNSIPDEIDADFLHYEAEDKFTIEQLKKRGIQIPKFAEDLMMPEFFDIEAITSVLFERKKPKNFRVIKKGAKKMMIYRGLDFRLIIKPYETIVAQDETIREYDLTLNDGYVTKERYLVDPGTLNNPEHRIREREFSYDKKMRLTSIKYTHYSIKKVKLSSSEERFEYEELK